MAKVENKLINNFVTGIRRFSHALSFEPPYSYDFLSKLDERDYPKYLKKVYKHFMHKELNLKHPKRLSEKIQWLKLHDNSQLKQNLTDKVLVRDYVKEKIGEKYLKPVLWTGDNFDSIPFESFPSSFLLRANHAPNWHFLIKDKEEFLSNTRLFDIVRFRFRDWLNMTFFVFTGTGFEYRNIIPKIIAEPVFVFQNDAEYTEYEIYCFNGTPSIFQKTSFISPPQHQSQSMIPAIIN